METILGWFFVCCVLFFFFCLAQRAKDDFGKVNRGVDNFLYNQEKKRQENEKNGG